MQAKWEHLGLKAEIPPIHRGAGRPTKAQAEARLEELLDAALDTFLERGFELATVEAIAARVNMTKRTVYAKFTDKAALFEAAVQRAIERQIVPRERLEKLDNGDLAETLEAIAHLRIAQVMTVNGLRLQRIINTESYRFPGLLMANYNQSAKPVAEFVAELLQRQIDAGELAPVDTMEAAGAFMAIAISGHVRNIVSGAQVVREELHGRVHFAVGLLLDGLRRR